MTNGRNNKRMPTQVTIHEYGTTVVLPCGAVVHGEPQDTESYAETARSLGYGDDVLSMAQHHDALHVALTEWLGIESFSLRQPAGLPVEAALAAHEEAAVMAVQRFARMAGVDVRKLCEAGK